MSEPLWQPSEQRVAEANLSRFIDYVNLRHEIGILNYDALYRWSVEHPEQFWAEVWYFCDIKSSHPWTTVLEQPATMPGAKWFTGVRLNYAENLLRRRDDKTALVYWSEDKIHRAVSYFELQQQVAKLAQAMRDMGIGVGDRVAGFMPNMPETIMAMLASASIGAIWSSCSPDFGINGAVERFGQIEPKLLFTADGYWFKGQAFTSLDKAQAIMEQIPSIERLVVARNCKCDISIDNIDKAVWLKEFANNNATKIKFEQLPFDHPLYILYSSGTTGLPKCIVHGTGGTLLQHMKELVLHTDLRPNDKLFYFTTCGWMMWNWLVSGLASGATLLLYDGSPFHPHPGHLFDYAEQEGMTIFGTSAKYLSALEKADVRPTESHQLTALRTMLTTGSPLLPESYDFVYRDIKADLQLSSISGGTDIVSCFALGNPLLPIYRGELQCRGLGMQVAIYDENGHAVEGQQGELVCEAPTPSMPIYFWNDPEMTRYKAAYFERFPGVWAHGDYAELTEHGGLIIYGRSDAVLNPGGVRIGTAEIYRQVEKLDEVMESIAVGQEWQGDVRIILFVKLREGLQLDEALITKIKTTLKQNATPRHVPAKVIQVTDIPRTISGKITELAVRNVIHGRPVTNTEALANPEVLEQFKDRAELSEP